jgi:hypothetical protein
MGNTLKIAGIVLAIVLLLGTFPGIAGNIPILRDIADAIHEFLVKNVTPENIGSWFGTGTYLLRAADPFKDEIANQAMEPSSWIFAVAVIVLLFGKPVWGAMSKWVGKMNNVNSGTAAIVGAGILLVIGMISIGQNVGKVLVIAGAVAALALASQLFLGRITGFVSTFAGGVTKFIIVAPAVIYGLVAIMAGAGINLVQDLGLSAQNNAIASIGGASAATSVLNTVLTSATQTGQSLGWQVSAILTGILVLFLGLKQPKSSSSSSKK